MKRYILLFLIVANLAPAAEPVQYTVEPLDPSVREKFHQRERAANVLVEPGAYVWGTSVIRWKDGKYHAFFAQWPNQANFSGWLFHCSVMHAVADQPQGPYKTFGVAVPSRPKTAKGLINAHNPYALIANDEVLLYFISNDLNDLYQPTEEAPFPSDKWLKTNRIPAVRNSQITTLASAKSPDGPFTVAEKTVVDPDTQPGFKNIAVNPAVIQHDGKFHMIIKGDDPAHEKWHRIQLIGTSDAPEGPFTFRKKPVYAKKQTEDACFWHNKTLGTFNMVCHVMGSPDLAWFTSKDAINWNPAPQPVFMKKQIPLSDGTAWKPARVERPFVLTNDQGEPEWIFVAIFDRGISGNIALKIRPKSPSGK